MRRTRARLTEERGFTLIEVLTVVLIIPILAGIAIPSFLGQKDKATDTEAKSAVRNAASAIELFHTEAVTYAGADAATLRQMEPSLDDVADENLIVAPNGAVGYTLTVKQAGTDNSFSITKASGVTTRTCTVEGTGGCPPSGTW